MKLIFGFVLLFVCMSLASFGQPRWSADIRAKRATEWMRDSLHLSEHQLTKARDIELNFERQIDKSGEDPATRVQVQQQLMNKKDAQMKTALSKTQYQKYYAHEMLIRKREQTIYHGDHQPQ